MKVEKDTRAWHSVCLAETILLPSADLDWYLLMSSMMGIPSRCCLGRGDCHFSELDQWHLTNPSACGLLPVGMELLYMV